MNNQKKFTLSFYLLGALYTITGILCMTFPLIFSIYLVYILAFLFLFNGLSNLLDGIRNINTPRHHWGMSLFLGIVEIILSFSIFVSPILSGIYLVLYIGFLLFIRGCFIVFNSFGQKSELKTPHTSTGIISILFGLLFIIAPLFSDKLIAITIAWFIIFSGIDLFIIGLGIDKNKSPLN